jgi:hypothetical protein
MGAIPARAVFVMKRQAGWFKAYSRLAELEVKLGFLTESGRELLDE